MKPARLSKAILWMHERHVYNDEFLSRIFGEAFQRIETLEKGFLVMADNFDALSAAVDTVVNEIQEVIQLIQSGANNNEQPMIDSLTAKLQGAANVLSGVLPAPAPAPAPVAAPAAADASAPAAPSDGSTPPAA